MPVDALREFGTDPPQEFGAVEVLWDGGIAEPLWDVGTVEPPQEDGGTDPPWDEGVMWEDIVEVRWCGSARDRSEAVTSKASFGSDEKMRGEAQRLRTVFFQLSTRLNIVHQSPYPDVGVGLPLRYPWWSDAACSIWMSLLGDISTLPFKVALILPVILDDVGAWA